MGERLRIFEVYRSRKAVADEWVAPRQILGAPVTAMGSIPHISQDASFSHWAVPAKLPELGNMTTILWQHDTDRIG